MKKIIYILPLLIVLLVSFNDKSSKSNAGSAYNCADCLIMYENQVSTTLQNGYFASFLECVETYTPAWEAVQQDLIDRLSEKQSEIMETISNDPETDPDIWDQMDDVWDGWYDDLQYGTGPYSPINNCISQYGQDYISAMNYINASYAECLSTCIP